MRKIISDHHGQAKVEYGLILALIAMSVFLVLSSSRFRCSLKSVYINVSYNLYMAGNSADNSEQVFQQFMLENGWDTSKYDYHDGNINCSDAPGSDDPAPEPDPVPWL